MSVEQVKSELNNYCSYGNLKEVYDRIVPSVVSVEKTFDNYSKQFEQMKLVVQQFDADLALKANKSFIFQVEQSVIENKRLMQTNIDAVAKLTQ